MRRQQVPEGPVKTSWLWVFVFGVKVGDSRQVMNSMQVSGAHLESAL